MDISPIPEYNEEIQMGFMPHDQYMPVIKQAVKELGWQLASEDTDSIMCQTPGGGASFGECVTIRIGDNVVLFHSRSSNEYYWVDNQNEANAVFFKESVMRVIAHNREIEKNLRPINRAKLGALVPSKSYLVTPILIYLNILVFLLMVLAGVSPLSPSTEQLLLFGGSSRSLDLDGQWWRLLTCTFVHGGIVHLLANMYALLYVGMFLEPLLGKTRFVMAYLLTGICASLMSITIHSFTVSVGASGAIFGLYGVFLAMLTTDHLEKTSRNTMLRSILFFVVYNLVAGMKGNIDNAAHIGGLLSGAVMGYIYYPGISRYDTVKKQLATTGFIAGGVIAVIVFAKFTLTDDRKLYSTDMEKFYNVQAMALEVYKMNENDKKENLLYNLQERGIYYWNEDLNVLNDISHLNIPDALMQKNNKLKQYCKLRIEVYQLMYKWIDAGKKDDFDDKIIKQDNEQISALLKEVNAEDSGDF